MSDRPADPPADDGWGTPTLHRGAAADAGPAPTPVPDPAPARAPGPAPGPAGGTRVTPVLDRPTAAGHGGADGADATAYDALATGYHAYTGADPVAAGGAGNGPAGPGTGGGGWSQAVVSGARETWSPTTYNGPRRHRPGRDDGPPPAAGAAGADAAGAPAAVAGPAAAQGRAAPAPERPADGHAGDDAATAHRGLLSSSRSMAVASLVSRVTGLLRTVAIGAALGSALGSVVDPYNAANSLPNMVYELLVGGVLSSVLIPLIVHAQTHDRDRGVAYTQRLLSIATVALAGATLLAVAAAPWIVDVVGGDPSQRELTTLFATLLLPEIFFYGVGALLTAVLNSREVYGPPAWAPVLNNVVVIATLVLFLLLPGGTPTVGTITDTQLLVLGVGTTLGIVVQSLVLVPALRRIGFHWQWRFRASAPGENARLREVRSLTVWILGYVAASQVGVVVVQRVGTARPPVGYSTFVYADLLFQVPYGILGVSLLTALMPRMSRAAATGDLRAVVSDLGLGARLSAVALVPVTFGLIVLGPSLTTTILLGKYRAADAAFVGDVLAWAAFGLVPFAVVMLQMRVFYAMRDARTPTLVNVTMVATKVALVGLSTVLLGSDHAVVRMLSVATSASYVVGALVGHVLLRRRLGALGFRAVGVTVARIGLASVVGAAVAWAVVHGLDALVGGARLGAALGLVLGAVLGGLVMVAVAWRLRIPELEDIVAAVRPARGPDRNTATAGAVDRSDPTPPTEERP